MQVYWGKYYLTWEFGVHITTHHIKLGYGPGYVVLQWKGVKI
jgi:hypothetical protein